MTILKAANVEIEPYWPGLFAKALEGVNIKTLITNVGSGVGAAPAGGGKKCKNLFFVTFFILLLVHPPFYCNFESNGQRFRGEIK